MTDETTNSADVTADRPAAPGRTRRRRRVVRRPATGATEATGANEAPSAQKEGPESGPPESPPKTGTSRPRRRRRTRTASTRTEEPKAPAQRKAAGTRQRRTAQAPKAAEEKPKATAEEPKEAGEAPRRRRRRRRRPSSAQQTATSEAAVEQAEQPSQAETPVVARPATRTRGRAAGGRRRRAPDVLVPRRTDKTMLITEREDRDQIAVIEGRDLVEHYVTRTRAMSMAGNVYLGKVQNVLPGMEAAFVDIGRGRNGVLYAGEVSYDEDVVGDARRIERALKPGQSVLVQVTKDPLGGKGARLTGQVSIPGRYLVYVPDGGVTGISRRLPDKERARLRPILKRLNPEGAGIIVRTAAEGASEEDLAADLDRLRKTWAEVSKKTKRAKAPASVYEEPELTIRVVRDVFAPGEFQEIVTDSKSIYEKIRAYLEEVAPDLAPRLRFHEGPLPLFESAHLHEQIHKALERKVWLPSGGHLVIDRTEAMTVIDVNTGKHVGKTSLEETVVGTNLEAATEVARQLRLRDIGGIIVIDFIDMLLEQNRGQVIQTLKEEMARDKTRSQVFDITPLGLLEVTRKKVSEGLLDAFSEPCPTCEGRGILVTHEL